jgi:hypothetical protein
MKGIIEAISLEYTIVLGVLLLIIIALVANVLFFPTKKEGKDKERDFLGMK